MEKLAQLSKYLPHLALTALTGGGLYGAYNLLKPEPTMWERMKGYGETAGKAIMPSVRDFASDLANASMNNPELFNAMAMNMAQMGQVPGGQMGVPGQGVPGSMAPMPSPATLPDQMNFQELQSLQNQLTDMNPYTSYGQGQY